MRSVKLQNKGIGLKKSISRILLRRIKGSILSAKIASSKPNDVQQTVRTSVEIGKGADASNGKEYFRDD